jgi:hypothetical protein
MALDPRKLKDTKQGLLNSVLKPTTTTAAPLQAIDPAKPLESVRPPATTTTTPAPTAPAPAMPMKSTEAPYTAPAPAKGETTTTAGQLQTQTNAPAGAAFTASGPNASAVQTGDAAQYQAQLVSMDPNKETVQGQLANLMATDNAVLQRARTKANQAANARGLINSSMAEEAAQAAMLDAGIPIATADAQLYADARNRNQEALNAAGATNVSEANKFKIADKQVETAFAQMTIEQQYALEKLAASAGYDMQKLNANQLLDLQKMAVAQQYDLTKMDKSAANEMAKMSVAQQNEIARMAIAQGYDLTKMSAANVYDLQKMQVANTFDMAKMDKQAALELNKLSIEQQGAMSRLAAQAGYDTARMSAQQVNDLAKMALNNEYDTARLNQQAGIALNQMSVGYQFDILKMAQAQNMDLAKMSAAQVMDLQKMAQANAYDKDAAANDQAFRTLLQQNEYTQQVDMAAIEKSTRMELLDLQNTYDTQIKNDQMFSNAFDTYTRALISIDTDPNLDAAAKAKMKADQLTVLKSAGAMYDVPVDLDFGTGAAPETPAAPTPAPTAPGTGGMIDNPGPIPGTV